MSLIKVLYISTLIFLNPQGPGESFNLDKCTGFEAKAVVNSDTGNMFSVEIEVKGGKSPYKYVFYKKSGHLLNEEFDKNRISKLEKGSYYCTVIENKGCYKTIEFEIK